MESSSRRIGTSQGIGLEQERYAEPSECRLVRAVLSQALDDWLLYSQERRLADKLSKAELLRIAYWVLSDEVVPWSFRWCCEILRLDPMAVRKACGMSRGHPSLTLGWP